MDHATPMDTDDAPTAPTVPDNVDGNSSPSSHTTDNESSDSDSDEVPQPSDKKARTNVKTVARHDNKTVKSGTQNEGTKQPKQAADVKGVPAEASAIDQESKPVDDDRGPQPPIKPKKAIPKLIMEAIKDGKTTLAMAQMQGLVTEEQVAWHDYCVKYRGPQKIKKPKPPKEKPFILEDEDGTHHKLMRLPGSEDIVRFQKPKKSHKSKKPKKPRVINIPIDDLIAGYSSGDDGGDQPVEVRLKAKKRPTKRKSNVTVTSEQVVIDMPQVKKAKATTAKDIKLIDAAERFKIAQDAVGPNKEIKKKGKHGEPDMRSVKPQTDAQKASFAKAVAKRNANIAARKAAKLAEQADAIANKTVDKIKENAKKIKEQQQPKPKPVVAPPKAKPVKDLSDLFS